MPYISKDRRDHLDKEINKLVKKMQGLYNGPCGGDLNYIFTRLAIGMDPKNYGELSEIIATFECAKSEFYRRLIAPYEDKKIGLNGDVPGFIEKWEKLLGK